MKDPYEGCIRCNAVVCLSCFQPSSLLPFPVHSEEQEQPLQWCVKKQHTHTQKKKNQEVCVLAEGGVRFYVERYSRELYLLELEKEKTLT